MIARLEKWSEAGFIKKSAPSIHEVHSDRLLVSGNETSSVYEVHRDRLMGSINGARSWFLKNLRLSSI